MLVLVSGCVERILTIQAEPADAVVYLDGRVLGPAPAEDAFDFYGTRVIEVRAPGYRPARRTVVLDPPWYQFPPIDLFADLLWPGTIRDEHVERVVLTPRAAPRSVAQLEAASARFAQRLDQEGDE